MLIQAPKTGFVGNDVVEVIIGLGLCWQQRKRLALLLIFPQSRRVWFSLVGSDPEARLTVKPANTCLSFRAEPGLRSACALEHYRGLRSSRLV